MTVNQENILERWVEALRSGKYKQGHARLRRLNNTFCCLGVLCDLYDNSKWEVSEKYRRCYAYDNNCAFPSDAMLLEVGLDLDFAETLSNYNDTGMSFVNIAGVIEEYINNGR